MSNFLDGTSHDLRALYISTCLTNCRCNAEEGDLRLADRIDINGFATGALQIFHDGAFGAVCGNNFGPPDASVACRQLGFAGGTNLPLAVVLDPRTSHVQPQVQVLYHNSSRDMQLLSLRQSQSMWTGDFLTLSARDSPMRAKLPFTLLPMFVYSCACSHVFCNSGCPAGQSFT